MGEITLEFTYEYTADGILWVTLMDLERDAVVLDRTPIGHGAVRDLAALVKLAGRVSDTMESGSRASRGDVPTLVPDDAEARNLVDKAQVKVIPFLDGAQAEVLRALVGAVESATNRELDQRSDRSRRSSESTPTSNSEVHAEALSHRCADKDSGVVAGTMA